MLEIISAIIFVIAAIVVPRLIPDGTRHINRGRGDYEEVNVSKRLFRIGASAVCGFIAIVFIFSTSFHFVDSDKTLHLKRIYGKDVPSGRIIAFSNEKGPQAEIMPPGFQFRFLMNVLYDVEEKPILSVPEGYCAILTAIDGAPLDQAHDQYIARGWPEGEFNQMLDARYFLGEDKGGVPRGQKGTQLTVLTPAEYRINYYLFPKDQIVFVKAQVVDEGFVAVVKSSVQETPEYRTSHKFDSFEGLAVPIVEKGSRGIWDKVVFPGTYFVNTKAYRYIPISTRANTWAYQGGYIKRYIDLEIDQEGRIKQKRRQETIPVPDDAADEAIFVKVDGWEVPVETRFIVQVTPDNAPFVVASVGGVEDIENKILTPIIRSEVRNVAGEQIELKVMKVADKKEDGKEAAALAKVMYLQDRRADLEKEVLVRVIPQALKAGINLKECKFGEVAIPPELMVARLREQLAQQLIETYRQEKNAQDERIQTEKARAEADQQDELIRSEIAKQVADNKAAERRKLGVGEKDFLMQMAKGQARQVAVLGKDRVMQLAILEKVLEAVVKNPDIAKVSRIRVSGGGGEGSLEGAAAILGDSNIAQALNDILGQAASGR